MTTYHEGQEIEVMQPSGATWIWRQAKIISARDFPTRMHPKAKEAYEVQFPDGSRGVYGAQHIRVDVSSAALGPCREAPEMETALTQRRLNDG